MFFSWLTKGSIGMGDGVLLVVTGVYLGGLGNLELFFTGLLLAACWSLGLLVFKRKRGKETVLLVSYLFMLARWLL